MAKKSKPADAKREWPPGEEPYRCSKCGSVYWDAPNKDDNEAALPPQVLRDQCTNCRTEITSDDRCYLNVDGNLVPYSGRLAEGQVLVEGKWPVDESYLERQRQRALRQLRRQQMDEAVAKAVAEGVDLEVTAGTSD